MALRDAPGMGRGEVGGAVPCAGCCLALLLARLMSGKTLVAPRQTLLVAQGRGCLSVLVRLPGPSLWCWLRGDVLMENQ